MERLSRRSALWLCAVLLGASLGWPRPPTGEAQPAATGGVRIGLRFHIAQRAGQPVAPQRFVETQLAHARRIFAPLGIELVRLDDAVLPETHAELVTRGDRDALARFTQQGVLDCMVVAKLMDVDEPGRERRGVHWTPRQAPERHFVVVSAISFADVLAHELGHFFGNPRHSVTPGNLMSYQRGEGPPFFDDGQKRKVRRALAAMLQSGELRPI